MFVKLSENGDIKEIAPNCITLGDSVMVNPTAEQYAELGYYELIENDHPKLDKWYHQETTIEFKDNKYNRIYTAVKDEAPVYSELLTKYIREKYSIEDEIAILRMKDSSDGKKSGYDEYASFIETCKSKADKDIEEWKKA